MPLDEVVKARNRGIERKRKAVMDVGGKCEKCGYNRNLAALCFHHIDPKDKSFALDLRAFSAYSDNKLATEINKCKLLCHNCHNEEHNDDKWASK